jgi:hypothetical protein
MACRRAYISNITSTLNQPAPQKPASITPPAERSELLGVITPVTTTVQQIEEKSVERDNITKRVLRSLLSECDYFETIKQETPMVYDNLKERGVQIKEVQEFLEVKSKKEKKAKKPVIGKIDPIQMYLKEEN